MIKQQRKDEETLNLIRTLKPVKLENGADVKSFSSEELKNYRKILKEIYPKGTLVKNIDTGIITANILYPHTFIYTEEKPAPYKYVLA